MQRSHAIIFLIAILSLFQSACSHRQTRPDSEIAESPSAASTKEPVINVATESLSEAPDKEMIDLQWPVDTARLSRGYKPGKKKHRHLGLDLAAPKNTPVMAAHDGVVVYSGRSIHGYGKMIMVEARPAEVATLYAHLSKYNVRQGQYVKQGDVIGFVGRTGHATGYHLHFELRTQDGALDPIPYLPAVASRHKVAGTGDETD